MTNCGLALKRKSLLLAGSIVVALLGAECVCRLAGDSGWEVPTEVLAPPGPYKLRFRASHRFTLAVPGERNFTVQTNPRGYQGPVVARTRGKPLRIVGIGDSFMLPWGVEFDQHSLPIFAKWYSNIHPDREVGLSMIGLPDWAPVDYYLAYLDEVRPEKVDVVVLGLFPGNDILPASTPRIRSRNRFPRTEHVPSPYRPPFWYPRLGQWVTRKLASSIWVSRLAIRFSRAPESFRRFIPDRAVQQKLWEPTFFYLEALAEVVRSDGAQLVVLVYPSVVQVNLADALDESGLNHGQPEVMVQAWCAAHKIPCIPFLPALRRANAKKDLYFPEDRHINSNGHRVCLEVMRESLTPVLDTSSGSQGSRR